MGELGTQQEGSVPLYQGVSYGLRLKAEIRKYVPPNVGIIIEKRFSLPDTHLIMFPRLAALSNSWIPSAQLIITHK